jgi:glutamyl-tRNA synthetase
MSSTTPVVTRYAPSPAGSLSIEGARTALFNSLYARHTGGRFLLRIEDTDRERSTKADVQLILDGLRWLGLEWDGEPTYQLARADRHREAVQQLLDGGMAYRCWLSGDELIAAKEAAHAAGHALRSPWRDKIPTAADLATPHSIRFKGPRSGDVIVRDLIQGDVTFRNRDLDDLIVLRADGAPTYNLAVIVDDHDMGVTHVIRGDDHLGNAARQTLMYQALGWDVPAFAHVPKISNENGAKLSRRHGAQSVGDFADMGFLPEALRNYLARLGWGHGDDELFSDEQAAEWFDVADVNKAAARLDWAALNDVNAHYIRLADDSRLAGLVAEVHARRGAPLSEQQIARLAGIMVILKDHARTLVDLADQSAFLFAQRPVSIGEKTLDLLTDETRGGLRRLADGLGRQTDWEAKALGAWLTAFAESEGASVDQIDSALRGVVAAAATSPDMGMTLSLLGKAETLGRIEDALSPAK